MYGGPEANKEGRGSKIIDLMLSIFSEKCVKVENVSRRVGEG